MPLPSMRRREFVGAGVATAVGVPIHTSAATGSMKHGWNVNGSSYYDGTSLFNNRLLESAIVGDATAKGYPPGGVGKSTRYVVISENAHEWWAYKPGAYVIKGTGTGARIRVGGAAISEISILTRERTPFRVSVVLPPLAAPTGEAALTFSRVGHLSVLVTDGTMPMSDLVVVHADDEAELAAGKVYTKDASDDLATASRGPVRPMGLMQTVSGWIKDPADIPADDSIAATNHFIQYPGHAPGQGKFRIPSPEKLARLAIESGNPLWVSLWAMASDAALKVFFDRLAAAYPSGDIYIEGGNEVWNNAYTANSGFLATQYGKSEHQGTGLVDGSSEAVMQNAAHLALRCFRAAEAPSAFNGRSRVKRVFNCQLVWLERSFIALDYVDPGIISKGRKLGQLIDSPCVATYFLLAGDALLTGGNTGRGITQLPKYGLGLSRRRLIRDKIYEKGASNSGNAAAWFEKAWKNSIDDVKGFIKRYQDRLTAAGFSPLRYSYEGAWSHDDLPAFDLGRESVEPKRPGGLPGICVAYHASTGAFIPADAKVGGAVFADADEPLDAWFDEGDLVQVGYEGATGVPAYRTFISRRQADGLRIYASLADYNADRPRVGGADGHMLLINNTRMTALNKALLQQLWANKSVDGTGVTVLDYYHDKMVEAGLTLDCTFTPVGAATTAFRDVTGTKPWAFKPNGYYASDTPALTWVRTKT